MRNTTEILGVEFDVLTMEEAIKKVMGFFGGKGSRFICTPNPEIVMEAQKDPQLMSILKAADMVVADGIGIVWASKYSRKKISERVTGYDLAFNLLKEMANKGKTAYFFGGEPSVAAAAAKRMTKEFPGLKIVGTHNGYFSSKEEKEIISEIKRLSPDMLFVGLGAPKQEKWIYENLRFTKAKVAIGIGGSFDVMAGKMKRAPKIYQKLGIEWLYRFIKQPSRWKRMMNLPLFVLKVLFRRNK
ncbi:MAG: WecB/TagA/CpsF family glycosyltransferase [Firmicutes bacterium]|nr:WecB/TagA/CpsF family glycosyltransferase [Bacillota bacterium]